MDHSVGMDMACVTLAFIDGLGAPEMGLIFILVLVLFGGDKLPAFARSLGKTLREFKKAAAGVEEEFKRALDEDERKQNQLKLAEPSTATPTRALNEPAGPDTTHEHYDHDYHAHEKPAETPAIIEGVSTPDAAAAEASTASEAGPMAPAAVVENTILPPASPVIPTPPSAAPPAAAPAPTPPPVASQPTPP